jgi:hypothetical protein
LQGTSVPGVGAGGRTILTVFEVKKEIPDLRKQLDVTPSNRLAVFFLRRDMPTKRRRLRFEKAVLDVVLNAATAQAEVVHELLLGQIDGSRVLGSELGGLLFEVVERSPEIINSFADGLTQILSSAGAVLNEPLWQSIPPVAPIRSPQESQPTAVPDDALPQPAPEPQPLTEAQLLNAILLAIADGYSTGQTGNAVSRSIRVRYPTAVPAMQKYLAMDDFLVLMWMRQQPAMAEIAKDTGFAQFYAELKAGIM